MQKQFVPKLAALAALALPAGVLGTNLVFDVTTSGTFAGDGGFPFTFVHVDHTSVAAGDLPFSFSGLAAPHVVNLLSTPTSGAGVFTFTGTGGDALFGNWLAVGVPGATPGELIVSGPFRFTGGTGKFEDASGGGDLKALVQFTGPANGVSSIAWDGTLSLVPEPEHCALVVGAALGLFGVGRRWRQVADRPRARAIRCPHHLGIPAPNPPGSSAIGSSEDADH